MNPIPAAVLGSGPAAWSLAAALTVRGVDVVLIAPDPDARWPQTYGMWTYQWTAALAEMSGISEPFANTWDSVAVIGDREHSVGHSYGVLDNERVRLGFRRAAEATGRASVRVGTAVEIREAGETCTVTLAGGGSLQAMVVFDGTGAGSMFIEREAAPSAKHPVLQTAFGLKVRARNIPFSEETCVLMDWRGPNRVDASFLYALPFGGRRWLFEETSLARHGGLDPIELEKRLRGRLDELGVVIESEDGTESVSFPMDIPIPRHGQRVVPIGAAAALVHPATGYSIAASLRTALTLSAVVADSGSLNGREITEQCWRVLWSTDRRKARRLETYGLERMLTMDQKDTRLFFDTFFNLDPKQTAVYLRGDAGAAELSGVMWALFRKAPVRLQRRLATGNPLMLARSLLR
jgi:lycopene beta-cyclase